MTDRGGLGSPPRLSPMLAGGNGVPPDPERYLFEPKLDGQRIIAVVEPGAVTLSNRRGADATATYPELVGLASALVPHSVVLDGEVVAFNEKGETSFQRLQRRMHVVTPTPRLLAETPVSFVAFDVLWLDGEPLVDRPQTERRAILDGLAIAGPAWQSAPVLDADPAELRAACRQMGLEGFMAKRRDAPYLVGGRSPAWWKMKCGRRREFVVGGWSSGRRTRPSGIGSLALGCYDVTAAQANSRGRAQQLYYVGQAGSGLNEEMIRQLSRLFDQITTPYPPFVNPPRLPLRWVEPVLVAEIAYTEVTEARTLRQPSIKGLRTDVIANDVVFDADFPASA